MIKADYSSAQTFDAYTLMNSALAKLLLFLLILQFDTSASLAKVTLKRIPMPDI